MFKVNVMNKLYEKSQEKKEYKKCFEELATNSRDFSHELVATYVNTKT